jgi:exodeoxyribonuclease-3
LRRRNRRRSEDIGETVADMGLRIATWNVNSIRLRLDLLAGLMKQQQPDVICLQETKVQDPDFPTEHFRALGYPHVLTRGMKAYNGVAIISRVPLKTPHGRDFCEKQDCRHLAARLPGGIELHNFYVPAGGDIPDPKANDKFAHKLRFVEEMTDWFAGDSAHRNRKMVLVGDLNIAPMEHDVWSHKQLLGVVSHTPPETDRMAALMATLGWVDSARHFVPADQKLYSWWSYRNRDWAASNRGRRLDHIWVTPNLKKSLRSTEILRDARNWTPPSDHVPVIVELA